MLKRSFIDKTNTPPMPFHLNSSPDLPLPENYHQYRQEIPMNYAPMPSNISPPRIYEQYSIPVPLQYEQKNLLIRSTPQRILTPMSQMHSNQVIREKNNIMMVKSPPPRAISTPRLMENQQVYISTPPLAQLNSIPAKKILTPRKNNEDLVVGLKMEIERLTFLLSEKEDEVSSFKAKCVHLESHLKDHSSPHHHNPRIQVTFRNFIKIF